MVNARYPVKIHPSLSNRVSLRLATSRAAFAISPGSFGVMLTCTGPLAFGLRAMRSSVAAIGRAGLPT